MLCSADEERRKDRQVSEDVVWIEWRMEVWSGLRVASRAESEPRLCQSTYENFHMESLPFHERGYDMVSKTVSYLFAKMEQVGGQNVCGSRSAHFYVSGLRSAYFHVSVQNLLLFVLH